MSRIIDANKIMRETNDEEFEKLIKKFKNFDDEELIREGATAFAEIFQTFPKLWNENDMQFVQVFMIFIVHSTSIACTDMKSVPERKKDLIGKFFLPLGEEMADRMRNDTLYFQPDAFKDNGYNEIMNILKASMQPLASPYPFLIYRFIIACIVADGANEAGLNLLRQIRNDYMDSALNTK